MAKGSYVQYVQYRIEGTSARRVEVLTPNPESLKQTQPLPKLQKVRRKVIPVDPVAVLGVSVAIIMLVMIVVGVVRVQAAQAELTQMQDNMNLLVQQNLYLSEQYEKKVNLRDIERTALALGMVPSAQKDVTVIDITPPPVEEDPPLWERIGAFFTELFA